MRDTIKSIIAAMVLLAIPAWSVAASAAGPAGPAVEEKKIEEITKAVAPSVVTVEVRDGIYKVATGVVIDKDGHIVTTALVSPRDEKITVITADGKRLAAEFKGFDIQTQVAVIQVREKGLVPIAAAKSADVRPGAWVGVIGLSPENTPAVTQGIVSSVASDKLRLNVWVVPGASGSPVVNEAGRMVGLLRGAYMDEQPVVFEFRERQVVGSGTVISRGEAPSAGMALAVPVDIVHSVAADIIKSGKVERGWLGVSTADEDGKVEVGDIEPKSPAELAKFKEGDVIVKIESKEITSSAALQQEIRNRKPGADVTIRIERDGKPMDVKVKLGEYTEAEAQRELENMFPKLFPPSFGQPRIWTKTVPKQTPPRFSLEPPGRFAFESRKFIGVTLQELTKAQAESFGVKDGYGLWVAEMAEDSPADKAGLKVGDVILKVDGKKVENPAELSAMIQDKKKGDKIKVEFIRDKKPMSVDVEISEDDQGWSGMIRDSEETARDLMDQVKQYAETFQKDFRNNAQSWTQDYERMLKELERQSESSTKGKSKINAISGSYYRI